MISKFSGKCPICDDDMEKGYVIVQGRGALGIIWSETANSFTGSEYLIGGTLSLKQVSAEGYRCRKCEIVLFSNEKEVEV